MILGIDIGNSTTCIGIFKNQRLIKTKKVENSKIIDVRKYVPKGVKKIRVSSCIPANEEIMVKMLSLTCKIKPYIINYKDVKNAYPGMGSDRIANLIGGKELVKGGVCVIDFGTATTIDVLGNDLEYKGGMILGGIKMEIEGLKRKTYIEKIPQKITKQIQLLGNSTVECIKKGIYWGKVYKVKGIVEEIRKKFKVAPIITGGGGKLVAEELNYKYEPWLTLWGLYFVKEKCLQE
jgi:type III pantothenate kinase